MRKCLIREIRESRGISRKQLAVNVGYSYGYISNIENDITSRPSAIRLQSIANFLGVKLTDLYEVDTEDCYVPPW